MARKCIKSIEVHVRNDDYFGTLATVLDLLRQDMEKSGGKRANKELLKRLRDDLVYFQENYKVKLRKD